MNNKIRFSEFNLVAVFAAFLLAVPLTGVAQDTTSSIRGKVNDDTGAPVSGATVVVEDMRTGVDHVYVTNAGGVFLATRLPVGGPYKVTVGGTKSVEVPSIALGDTYSLTINMQSGAEIEEIVVIGTTAEGVDVAIGPASTYTSFDLETNVAFNRDITDVYGLDPRFNIDNEDDGFAINCMGMHPRFNSVTLDGVSQNDRFGLNDNGYSTATGMPFPYDGLEQVSVELAPFDVTYGGFSACNINAVTKSGTNEWQGNVFYEFTGDSMRGDAINDEDIIAPPYHENKYGVSVGGPIIKDRLFVFAAYEKSDEARFLARGYDGSGNGIERDWLSKADYDLIVNTAINTYNYDPGGQPLDGRQENEKYMLRLDLNIAEDHNAALIYNYFDGFQDRDSDGDTDEFEFANHFYQKGAESETITFKLASQWTDAFSTELFYSHNKMDDSQVTVGPKDFGDHQISLPDGDVYMGADDSRQANKLGTKSDFVKLAAQFLVGDHVITAGAEREDLEIFNIFVQHSNGGEWDYYGVNNRNGDGLPDPGYCAGLDAAGRFADTACDLLAIDQFVLGRPSRIYYGSGGGSNNPLDAAALFSNAMNAVYVQDEIYFDDIDLTLVAGVRYEWFTSSDRPVYNDAFFVHANGGYKNDVNIDGLDLIMPRLGFTWGARNDLTLRGGVGLYSGGNPNVWISNAWSNDGVTNVQKTWSNFSATQNVLDGSVLLSRQGRPGYDVPQTLLDQVAATTAAQAATRALVFIDPNYKQPGLWKYTLGATWDLPWGGITTDIDYIHSEQVDPAQYVDTSQAIIGTTIIGTPRYAFQSGVSDNLMLTNSLSEGSADMFSIGFYKDFGNGLDLSLGYAYTDAEDVMPMTSSVAVSNWENLATSDVNVPLPAKSNYVVPHRITFRVSYGTEFFGDLTTRFTAYGYAAEGQPQSYAMGGAGQFEGDGFFGRTLLYVPTGPSDPNVIFGAGFDQAAFFAWVAREGLAPGIQARNAQHAPWSNRIDIRIDQDIPTFFEGTRGRIFFKLYNLGNFLHNKWGDVNDAEFFTPQIVTAAVDPVTGQLIFNSFRDRSIVNLREDRSLWEARFGIDIFFGE